MSAPALLWGQEWSDADDVTLLGMVRGGDAEAYAELWRRHLPAAVSYTHLDVYKRQSMSRPTTSTSKGSPGSPSISRPAGPGPTPPSLP